LVCARPAVILTAFYLSIFATVQCSLHSQRFFYPSEHLIVLSQHSAIFLSISILYSIVTTFNDFSVHQYTEYTV
jgi:hypothetical protein